MSQPAARLGDPTAHGGAVTSGNPTVLIGGQPAATMGDLHVCPLCSPGPHVGGPVVVGAPTVLIGGRPAARMGDQCVCAAPAPDVIAGGCPTVLIGSAGGGGSAGATAAVASAAGAALRPGTPGTGATARPLSPWVGVGYADGAGRPVAGWAYHAGGGGDARDGQLGTGGQVWCDGLAESGSVEVGLVGVYGCRWERDEARVGEAVGMSARCVGVADGALAHFEVWREAVAASGGVERSKVAEVMGEVAGGRVEGATPFVLSWPTGDDLQEQVVLQVAPDGEDPPPYDAGSLSRSSVAGDAEMGRPSRYVFRVSVGGVHGAVSPSIRFLDRADVTLRDDSDEPMASATVRVVMSDGQVQTFTSNAEGVVQIIDVDPGRCSIVSIEPHTV